MCPWDHLQRKRTPWHFFQKNYKPHNQKSLADPTPRPLLKEMQTSSLRIHLTLCNSFQLLPLESCPWAPCDRKRFYNKHSFPLLHVQYVCANLNPNPSLPLNSPWASNSRKLSMIMCYNISVMFYILKSLIFLNQTLYLTLTQCCHLDFFIDLWGCLNERAFVCVYVCVLQSVREKERDSSQTMSSQNLLCVFHPGQVCKTQDWSLQIWVWVSWKEHFFHFFSLSLCDFPPVPQ